MSDPARPSPESETRLLRTAQERGVLSAEQVEEALRTRQTLGDAGLARALEDVLFEKGVFTPEQVRAYRQIASETMPVSDATRLAGWERTTAATPRPGAAAPRSGQACPERAERVEGPGEPVGRYRLMEALGHGGMGVVWKAWDTELRRVVALKQILGDAGRGQAIERFLREARAAARLRHPGIVSVYDVGVIDGRHYLTADFVEGTSLDKRLRQGISTRDAVAIVKGVAEALQYAHDQGVVHRDIKPGNILLDRSGTPHVADFGLAKDASLGSGPALTVSGDLLGTPSYMSPEQARGRPDEQGPRSDQFSLGVMLYEMVTGRLPFGGSSLQDILNAITDSEPTPPTRHQRKLHADVETVILKMLEKDPAKRYPSMRDLAADLGRVLEAEPIEARRPGLASRLARRAAKHRRLSIATLAVLLAGTALSAYAWRKRVEGREAQAQLAAAAATQDVIRRWVGLSETLREMERTWYDTELSEEQVREANSPRWARVEGFIAETPSDATSQATMKALAGWARTIFGDSERGLAMIREARAVDPTNAYARGMEALVSVERALQKWAVPDLQFEDVPYRTCPPPAASDVAAQAAARMDELVSEATRGPVPGEGFAADLYRTLRAVAALRAGRGDEAARELSAVVGSPAMSVHGAVLHECRARALTLTGRLDEARFEWSRVLEHRKTLPGRSTHIGQIAAREALEVEREGDDARDEMLKAIGCLTEATGVDDERSRAHLWRGVFICLWADMEDQHEGAWEDGYRAALDDFTRCVGWPETRTAALFDRAMAAFYFAGTLQRHEKDAHAELERASEDAGALLVEQPEDAPLLELAARIDWLRSATAEGAVRVDLRKKALDRAEHALRIGPDGPSLRALGAGIALDLTLVEESKEEIGRLREAAFGHLRRAVELGWGDAASMEADPALAPLRSDPRWKGLVDSLPRK